MRSPIEPRAGGLPWTKNLSLSTRSCECPSRRVPGQVAKRDNECKRCGTANVFCAVEPKAGKHFTFPSPNRSAPELARVLNRIIGSYPFARTIHLVMDNLNIHCRKTLTDYFGEEKGAYLWNRLSVHYTPKHGGWLNQAVSRKTQIPSLALLQQEAHAWNRNINRDKTTIDWRFSRKNARQKFGYDKNSFERSQT